jgi:hypothetical protein
MQFHFMVLMIKQLPILLSAGRIVDDFLSCHSSHYFSCRDFAKDVVGLIFSLLLSPPSLASIIPFSPCSHFRQALVVR